MLKSTILRRLAALLLFLALSVALFGGAVDPRSALIGNPEDGFSSVWFLLWWPWAIARGLDPLMTHLVWFPGGYNLAWATPVPTAALLGLPITLLASPVAAYDILMLLAPALAAWTAFLLAERITRDWAAAMAAGVLFGFSAFVSGQMQGHLNLVLVFLIPLAVLFAWQRARGELSARGFVVRLVVVLVLQFGLSVEVFASLCLFGGGASLLFLAAGPRATRPVAARLVAEIVLAGVGAGVLVSPYLAHMAQGHGSLQAFVNAPGAYSTDLLNFVVPTRLTWLSPASLAPLAANFPGNLSEQGGYLGLPLLVLVGLYAGASWRNPMARVLLLAFAALAVASLGPFLWVGGRALTVMLPWLPVTHLPLIQGALPARFSAYVALAASLIAALWLAAASAPGVRRRRMALATLACVAVLPNPSGLSWTPVPALAFFEPGNIRARLPTGANLLLLPFGALGPGMFWQAQSGMAFTQSAGNLSFLPAELLHERVLPTLWGQPPSDSFANDLLAFCAGHQVSVIVAGPGTPPKLSAALEQLSWAHEASGGVRLFHVPEHGHYVALGGDHWPGMDAWSIMGRQMTVTTHGAGARLLLNAAMRPTVPVTVTVHGGVATRRVVVSGVEPLDLAADRTVTLDADAVFRPDDLTHNGDQREVSLLVRVVPDGE